MTPKPYNSDNEENRDEEFVREQRILAERRAANARLREENRAFLIQLRARTVRNHHNRVKLYTIK